MPKRLSKRDKIIRTGAIVIVLALIMSLLAGALSFAPAQAGTLANASQFVQNQEIIDTDADGIPNNEDPDIDGDGLVNAEDPDIDGDGTANFDDGDPAGTNGFDGKKPIQPGAITLEELAETGALGWIILAGIFLVLAFVAAGLLFRAKLGKNKAKRP